MARLGAVADDFTGATDLATALVSFGLRTVVTVGVPDEPAPVADADAVVVALRTRTAPVEQAVSESVAAVRALRAWGCERFYLKYCSTFDSTPQGNIGPVADALLAELDAPGAVVVPSFPANRRTVYQGVLFADGVPLAESSMRSHPLTPMTDSDVVRLLAPQTTHAVGLVRHEAVRAGADAMRRELDALHASGRRLVVVDAIDDADLRTIGAATADDVLVTGGSGLALGLPAQQSAVTTDDVRRLPDVAPSPRAVLVGSMSAASRRQVAHAADRLAHRAVDLGAALRDPAAEAATLAGWVTERWQERPGDPVMVHSADGDARPAGADVAEAVETVFAALARHLADAGARRFVVGGGETSGRVTAALGVTALTVGPQIAPGVAWTYGHAPGPTDHAAPHDRPAVATGHLLALKSGNFGADDFFTTAWDALG